MKHWIVAIVATAVAFGLTSRVEAKGKPKAVKNLHLRCVSGGDLCTEYRKYGQAIAMIEDDRVYKEGFVITGTGDCRAKKPRK